MDEYRGLDTLAKLKRITRMSSPIARILHFSFETAENLIYGL